MSTKHTYDLTFRGEPVRWYHNRAKQSWTTVYDVQYVLLTYRRHANGSIDRVPTIAEAYKTAGSCKIALRDYGRLNQWKGQSFIIGPIKAGTSEITDTPVVEG